jgi:lysophospholipase L1-like esterase
MARRMLLEFKEMVKSYGGNPIVVYLPSARYYYKKWSDMEYKMVESLCGELGIGFVDLVKAFGSSKDPKEFFSPSPYVSTIGGHCNRKGYALVAEEIIKHLYRNRN